jgi:hypothetical protein
MQTGAGVRVASSPVDDSLVKPAFIVILAGYAIMLIPFPFTGMIGGIVAGFCGLIMGIVNMARGAVTAGVIQVLLGLIGTPIVYAISWIVMLIIGTAMSQT